MVTNVEANGEARYYLVVNGATKWDDIAYLREHLPDAVTLNHLEDQALLALQGPSAAAALETVVPGVAGTLTFMQGTAVQWQGVPLGIGRSGYTGEDGFEVCIISSIPSTVLSRRDRSPSRHRKLWMSPICCQNPPSSSQGSARATRCDSRPACASTAKI